MIVHLVVFFLISFIFLSIGLLSIKVFEYLSKNRINKDYTGLVILGLIVTATLLRFLYLFFPINSFVFTFLLICSLLIGIFYRSDLFSIIKLFFSIFLRNKVYFLVFILITFYIGYKSSLLPSTYDVDLYQANTIRWIENFKIIPGLANLHSRLGFMGSWHILAACFSFSSVSNLTAHALNGWVVWFFVIYCLQGILNTKNVNSLVIAKLFFILFVFLINTVGRYLSSPTTDIPIIVFSWIVFLLFLSRKESLKNNDLINLNLIILPVFLITIKLSAISLPLISLFVLFSKKIPIYLKKIGLIISTLIISIQIFSSVILTGYLLYPVSETGLYFLDWTLPKSLVIEEREGIKSWAIRPRIDKDIVSQASSISNIYYWYAGLSVFEKLIIILLYLSVTGLVIKVLFSKIFNKQLLSIHPMIILVYVLGLISWILLAPDFRFGYGYIIVVLFILFFTLFNFGSLSLKVNKKLGVIFICLGIFIVFYKISKELRWYPEALVYPVGYQERKVEEVIIGDLLFFVPDHEYEIDQTGYWGFPGTPEFKDGFYLLGQEYIDGFGIKSEE